MICRFLAISIFLFGATQLPAQVSLFVDLTDEGAMSLVGSELINGIRLTSEKGLIIVDVDTSADPFTGFFQRTPTEVLMNNFSVFSQIDGVVPIAPRLDISEPPFDLMFEFGVGSPPLRGLVVGPVVYVPEPSSARITAILLLLIGFRLVRSPTRRTNGNETFFGGP